MHTHEWIAGRPHQCPVCGKKFWAYADWQYSRKTKGKKTYYCSWPCFRKTEAVKDYEAETVCYTSKREEISTKEIPSLFGDILEKHKKMEEFILRSRTKAQVIPAEELGKYGTALFQAAARGLMEYSLSDIMVDFEIDQRTGKVTATKLWRYRGKNELETRTYFMGNYGKTWRAWSALPEDEAAKWDKYD